MRPITPTSTQLPETPPKSPDEAGDGHRPNVATDTVSGAPSRAAPAGLQSPLALPSPSRAPRAFASEAAHDGPTQIRPYLYVGGIDNARNRMSLFTLGITHILSAAAEYPPAAVPGIETMHLALYDRTNERTAPHIPAAIAWIDAARRANGRVLVHCQHGISRSITIVLAYLMTHEQATLAASLQSVRAVRAESEPNPSFLGELRELEEHLFGRVVSTQQLTVLDPGPLDLASSDAQTKHIVQKCLAAATVDRSAVERDRHEEHAANLLERTTVGECVGLLSTVVMQSFESFAGASSRDTAARASLHRIVGHLKRHDAVGAEAVHEVLTTLGQTPEWLDLTIDVPMARRYLAEIDAALGVVV